MTTSQPRYDVDALQDIAGGTVFGRGKSYHENGFVTLISVGPTSVLAQVEGTEDYRTRVTGSGKEIDGDCSCPAYEDRGFCKHMVAVALAANEARTTDGAIDDASARIRAYLYGQSVDTLANMIVELAERDMSLFRTLDMAAAVLQDDEKTVEARLRKALDTAIGAPGHVDYWSAGAWAADVKDVLDAVATLVPAGRVPLALKFVERAIGGIEEAMEEIDDSDGHCSGLLEYAAEIHLDAAREIRPEPVAFARSLFEREMGGDFETFDDSAARYADVLGEAGLAEYRRLATEAWDKLRPKSSPQRGNGTGDDGLSFNRHRLRNILDFFFESDGDVDARIALRTKDLSSQWNYIELVDFCIEQGRNEEALRWAEEGLRLFEDKRQEQRLVTLVAELRAKAGQPDAAEALLWQAFEKEPTQELYGRLRKLGGVAARDRALRIVEDRIPKRREGWRFPGDFLIDILIDEKLYDTAWTAVTKHGASIETKHQLARATEITHAAQALSVYTEHVEQLIATGSRYEDAVKVIKRMGTLREADEQAAYVAGIKARHGRKRNLMKLLG